MSSKKERKMLRPLGHLERYHHIRSKIGFYNNIASTAQYVLSAQILEKRGGLQSVIFAALKDIIHKQPVMGVVVEIEKPQKPLFVKLDSINLDEVVRFQSISRGHQFIEDEHQRPLERLGELPLWRVVVAKHENENTLASSSGNNSMEIAFQVGYFFDHTIADGLSGVAFHLDFLEALNRLGASEAPVALVERVVSVPELELLPSMQDAAHWPLSFWFIGASIFKAFVIKDNDAKRWTGNPITFSTEKPPETRLLTIILDSETSSKISQLCRKNDATITPLITVLIARHLANVYPSHTRFLGTLALSLRRFTGMNNRQMADHVSGVTVHCSTEKESGYLSCKYIDWDVVRAARSVIDAAASSPANQITVMLKFLTDVEDYLKKQVGKTGSHSFEVSNVGLVDGGMGGTGMAKFRRMIFSQSANVTGAPYVFSLATVKGGDMSIALTWQKGIVEDEKANDVVKALELELHHLAIEAELQNSIHTK